MKARVRIIVMLILAPVIALGVFAGGVKDEAMAAVEVVKFSTPVAPDHPNNIAALKFAEIVNKNAAGRLKVEVFPANQLGDVKDVIENVMTGSVHMYMGGTSETSLFQPEFAVMDAPYLFRDYAHLMKGAKSDVMKEMGAKLEKNRGVSS